MRYQMIKCDCCGKKEETNPEYKYRSITVRDGNYAFADFDLCSECFESGKPLKLEIDAKGKKSRVSVEVTS